MGGGNTMNEHQIQANAIRILDHLVVLARPEICPELKDRKTKIVYKVAPVFAPPNGGLRQGISGAFLRAEGARSGIPDLICPLFGGLYIEVKTETGRLSENQKEWLRIIAKYSTNKTVVCRTTDHIISEVLEHLGIEGWKK
jgi:hypothetical protein